jgi:hypothetical protein
LLVPQLGQNLAEASWGVEGMELGRKLEEIHGFPIGFWRKPCEVMQNLWIEGILVYYQVS